MKHGQAVLACAAIVAAGLLLASTLGVRAQSSGPIYSPAGSRQQPSYSYTINPRLGSFRVEQDVEGFAADGQLVWHYGTTLMHLTTLNLRVGGTLTSQSALGVGIDTPAAALHVVGSAAVVNALTAGGLAVGASGLLASTDNAADLGASGASRFRDAFLARNLHVTGWAHAQAGFALGVHAVSIASTGAESSNAEILTATRPILRIECLAADCTLHVSTAGLAPGTALTLVNIGPNSIRLFDVTTAGRIMHVAGAFVGARNALIEFVLIPDTSDSPAWIERTRSAN